MKRYNSLDYVKGICCIAVIFIHYNFKGDLGLAVKAMSRFAVPIFFFISGFFFVGKDYLIKREKTIMKIKHLVSLLIKSAIFYAIFCIIWNNLYTQNFNLTEYIDKVISKESIIKFVVTNDPFVYSHLWFILALVYCYITFIPTFLMKRLRMRKIISQSITVLILITLQNRVRIPARRFRMLMKLSDLQIF